MSPCSKCGGQYTYPNSSDSLNEPNKQLLQLATQPICRARSSVCEFNKTQTAGIRADPLTAGWSLVAFRLYFVIWGRCCHKMSVCLSVYHAPISRQRFLWCITSGRQHQLPQNAVDQDRDWSVIRSTVPSRLSAVDFFIDADLRQRTRTDCRGLLDSCDNSTASDSPMVNPML